MDDKFLRIGDKIVRIFDFKKIGDKTVPIIKADSKEIKHPDGRVDVIVTLPCLHLAGKPNKLGG